MRPGMDKKDELNLAAEVASSVNARARNRKGARRRRSRSRTGRPDRGDWPTPANAHWRKTSVIRRWREQCTSQLPPGQAPRAGLHGGPSPPFHPMPASAGGRVYPANPIAALCPSGEGPFRRRAIVLSAAANDVNPTLLKAP